MIHYIIIYLKLTKTIKRYKRFWTCCKNIKTDSLKFLEWIPGNRDSTDVKTDNSRLFSDIWSTSGPLPVHATSRSYPRHVLVKDRPETGGNEPGMILVSEKLIMINLE